MALRAQTFGLYIDGTIYVPNTTYAVKTCSASECYGGTVRLGVYGGTGAKIKAWMGDNTTDDRWMIVPETQMVQGSHIVIPSISMGPNQSLYFRSDAFGTFCSMDAGKEDDYSMHKSGACVIDGTTNPIDTWIDICTTATGDAYRGSLMIVNPTATRGWTLALRGTYEEEMVVNASYVEPGQIVEVNDIVHGSDAGARWVKVRSSLVGMCFSYRGFQIEG